ncbi:MAG: HEAT repeat domain-containing protein [Lacrimispora sphenoides]
MFRKNAAIALGNTENPEHVPALKAALNTGEPMVREAAAWHWDELAVTQQRRRWMPTQTEKPRKNKRRLII